MSQVRVEGSHDFAVLNGVSSLDCAQRQLGVPVQHVIDCVRAQNVLNVGVGHAYFWQTPVPAQILSVRVLGGCPEDAVELFECTLGPDHESADVSSGRQFQDAQTVHVAEVQSG